MKITKALYITKSDSILTPEDVASSLFLHGDMKTISTPKSWIFLDIVEIDIPDSTIDDIIGDNTEIDIAKRISDHEAEIAKLVELRNRSK